MLLNYVLIVTSVYITDATPLLLDDVNDIDNRQLF